MNTRTLAGLGIQAHAASPVAWTSAVDDVHAETPRPEICVILSAVEEASFKTIELQNFLVSVKLLGHLRASIKPRSIALPLDRVEIDTAPFIGQPQYRSRHPRKVLQVKRMTTFLGLTARRLALVRISIHGPLPVYGSICSAPRSCVASTLRSISPSAFTDYPS